MLQHEPVPDLMPGPRCRQGVAGLLAATALTLCVAVASVPAVAQTATPATGGTPTPAMVQAPTAPVPPASPTAPVLPRTSTVASTTPNDIDAATFQSKVGKEKAMKIENHIARLHAALKITPGEEPLWHNFASVMRQTVMQLDAVYARRQAAYGSMDAVQDLESYGEVQDANAHNVQMLLPPFRALYDALTPEQKKAADAAFQRNTDKALKKSG